MVSCDVALNLLNPVTAIVDTLHLCLKRKKSTLLPLPAVPKIPVHKHRNLASSEGKIGLAQDAWCAHSKSETETVESASQIPLWLCMGAANAPHRAGNDSGISEFSPCLRHHIAIVVRRSSIDYMLWIRLSIATISVGDQDPEGRRHPQIRNPLAPPASDSGVAGDVVSRVVPGER